jgi:hypothetical protein
MSCPKCHMSYSVVPKSKTKTICKPCHNRDSREAYHAKMQQQKIDIANGNITTAVCKHCKEIKSVDQFNLQLKHCRLCSSLMQKERLSKEETKIRKESKLMQLKSEDVLTCVCCKVEKSVSEYSARNLTCKQCVQKRNTAKYELKKEEIKSYQKHKTQMRKETKYVPSITEKTCTSCKETKSVDEFSFSYGNGYQPRCNACRREEARIYRQENIEQIRARARLSYIDKPRTQRCVITSLRIIAKKCVQNTSGSCTQLVKKWLGCEPQFFVDWLQWNCSLDGLCFEIKNASWHIDHIIPCSLFNWDESNSCFHWTNMMPLKAELNISKQNKIVLTQIETVKKRIQEFLETKDFNQEKIAEQMIHWNTSLDMMINQAPKKQIMNDFYKPTSASVLVTGC